MPRTHKKPLTYCRICSGLVFHADLKEGACVDCRKLLRTATAVRCEPWECRRVTYLWHKRALDTIVAEGLTELLAAHSMQKLEAEAREFQLARNPRPLMVMESYA